MSRTADNGDYGHPLGWGCVRPLVQEAVRTITESALSLAASRINIVAGQPDKGRTFCICPLRPDILSLSGARHANKRLATAVSVAHARTRRLFGAVKTRHPSGFSRLRGSMGLPDWSPVPACLRHKQKRYDRRTAGSANAGSGRCSVVRLPAAACRSVQEHGAYIYTGLVRYGSNLSLRCENGQVYNLNRGPCR